MISVESRETGEWLEWKLALEMRLAPWSAVAERDTSGDTALGTRARARTPVRPPEIPSESGVALSLPAALQGSARIAPFALTTNARLNM